MQLLYLWYSNYRIAENFREFRGFVAIRESFLHEIWGVVPLALEKRAIRKSFLRENRIFTNSRKFSPSKVFRYMVLHLLFHPTQW